MSNDLATTLPLSLLVNQRHQHPEQYRPIPIKAGLWVGPFQGAKRGQGTDFDDLRDYVAGDELRHIDWKTSARRGNLSTRLYREEKEHVVTFVTDFSSPMFTGSEELLSVTTGRLTAALMWHAIDAGSRLSLVALSDTNLESTRPATGHSSAIAACSLMASTFKNARTIALENERSSPNNNIKQRIKHSTEQKSLTHALEELLALGRRVGSVILVSNFTNTSDSFLIRLKELAKARPLIAIHVEDPLCFDGLPSGRYRYQSTHKGRINLRIAQLRSQDRQKLMDILQKQQQQVHDVFEEAKVSLIDGTQSLSVIKTTLHQQGYLA